MMASTISPNDSGDIAKNELRTLDSSVMRDDHHLHLKQCSLMLRKSR
jgi:hypothetical protein